MEERIAESVRAIYQRLQDEESRTIFRHKLMHFLDGDFEHIMDMVQDAVLYNASRHPNQQTIKNLVDTYDGEEIVCFGAGFYAEKAIQFFKRYQLPITCFCDSDPKKQDTMRQGYRVISPEQLLDAHRNAIVVITTIKGNFHQEVMSFLLRNGIERDRVYSLCFLEYQYFGPPFMRTGTEESYVDVGAYDGDTLRIFAAFCDNRYRKIIAFEPDPVLASRAKRLIQELALPNVELIEKVSGRKRLY